MERKPDKNHITRQIHSDSQNLRRSFLAMQLLAAGDLQRYAHKGSKND
jgi:hypothetical protein